MNYAKLAIVAKLFYEVSYQYRKVTDTSGLLAASARTANGIRLELLGRFSDKAFLLTDIVPDLFLRLLSTNDGTSIMICEIAHYK